MGILSGILAVMLGLTAIFLILLILIQRGRGGGLAGAFGGMGGQSAFGTKAGDLFTRVTIVTAAVWILLCALSVKIFSSGSERVVDANAAAETESRSGGKASPAADKGDRDAKESGATEKSGTAEGKGKDKAAAAPASSATKGKMPAAASPAAKDKAPAEDK